LSFQLHPDKHQSADLNIDVTSSASNGSDAQKEVHDRFVAVNTAYGVLSKPSTKEIYDLGLSRESMFGGNSSENSRNHRYKYR
jgi:curved DNA-binding protein CbpA